MKKAISLFLALVMLVSVFAGLGITAYAADAQTSGSIRSTAATAPPVRRLPPSRRLKRQKPLLQR